MSAYPLTDLTVVLGPPAAEGDTFADFQSRAARGDAVAEHAWARHEYAALDALTVRDGSISTHTLVETMIGGVLQVGTLIADVERQWVRHEDGHLHAALTICSEDVRPRAAGLAFHDPALVGALNATGRTIATLDDRAWIRWSSRTRQDAGDPAVLARSAALVGDIAALVIAAAPTPDAAPGEAVSLEPELLTAIRLGRAHADAHSPLTRELRDVRHLDPMRAEWTRVLMDAFYLAALDRAQIDTRAGGQSLAALAFLYLGKERSDRLKANPDLSPRFRGEIAAKTFMTAYALERLAPVVSAALFEAMREAR